MAAAPEGEGLFADPEPFSPSIFLDLPPTPRPDGNGEVPASSDDLVLPFITRILMEEDINDQFFYQFPDHPVLLQAQEPYAQILSDAATATVPPSSSDGPAQLLLSPPYPDTGLHGFTDDGVGPFFLPAQDGGSPELEQSPAQLRAAGDGDGDHAALASVFFNRGDADAEMLNKAFLKGMEEAKKFLPTTNSLLIDREAEEEELGINGRGRKDRDRLSWDDLEAETCRKSKLMVPEPEETGEVVDEMIVNGLELCLKEMEALRITMGSEAKKKARKGRSSSNEAVELSTLLIHCAQAVATDNRRSATELLRQIKQHSSPKGDATQRLARCFAEGLEARLAGSGSQLYRSLMAERIPVVEYLKAYWLYLAACCFKMTAFRFSNRTILKAIAGRKKVHIVDYGVNYGVQWPALLYHLANFEGGPPEVRITGIDLPQPGFRPARRELCSSARCAIQVPRHHGEVGHSLC